MRSVVRHGWVRPGHCSGHHVFGICGMVPARGAGGSILAGGSAWRAIGTRLRSSLSIVRQIVVVLGGCLGRGVVRARVRRSLGRLALLDDAGGSMQERRRRALMVMTLMLQTENRQYIQFLARVANVPMRVAKLCTRLQAKSRLAEGGMARARAGGIAGACAFSE